MMISKVAFLPDDNAKSLPTTCCAADSNCSQLKESFFSRQLMLHLSAVGLDFRTLKAYLTTAGQFCKNFQDLIRFKIKRVVTQIRLRIIHINDCAYLVRVDVTLKS